MSPERHDVHGIARVVRLDGERAWLEPEQTNSCGHCASAGACGAKGMGTLASRLEQRRFPVDNVTALHVGERVVVVVDDRALLKGALTAYGLPLASALLTGGLAQWLFGGDLPAMAGMVAGLGAGLGLARLAARRLKDAGALEPRVLRRAGPTESCH